MFCWKHESTIETRRDKQISTPGANFNSDRFDDGGQRQERDSNPRPDRVDHGTTGPPFRDRMSIDHDLQVPLKEADAFQLKYESLMFRRSLSMGVLI